MNCGRFSLVGIWLSFEFQLKGQRARVRKGKAAQVKKPY